MTNDNTKKQEPTKKSQSLVKTFRRGAIAANVWKRQTPLGFEYLDFSLSRSWKLKSGEKEGYSQNFFESNEEALIQVIEEATDFIRQHDASGLSTKPEKQRDELSTSAA